MKMTTRTWCSSPVTRSLSRKLVAAGFITALALVPENAFAAGTTFRQTILTELRYDTNARIAAEGELNGDDVVLLIVPGFEAINQRNKLTLTGIYRPSGYYYFKQPELNTISHSGTIMAEYAFSPRTSMTAEERITYSKESLESTLTGYQNRRSGILTNTVNLSMNHALTHRTSVTLSASDYLLKFDDPVAVDSRNVSGSMGLNFQATPETQLNSSYNFSRANYDLPGGSSSNQNTHSLNAGFSTRYRETTTLLVSGGAVYAETPGTGDGFFDWVALAEIRKTFNKYDTNFSYSRRTTSSSGVTDQLTLNDSFSAGLRREINRNVSVNLSGNYMRNHSKPDDSFDTKSFTASASGAWQMRDWLSFGIGYAHFSQVSDGPLGEDLERDHIFVNINMTTFEGRL